MIFNYVKTSVKLIFKRNKQKGKEALFYLLTLILFLLSLEFCLRYFNNPPPSERENIFEQNIVRYNSSIGYNGQSNVTTKDYTDATVTLGNYGMRVSSNFSSENKALFLGCSYMFGEGLEYDKAIPYSFSQRTENQSISLSFPSYGANHLLATLDVLLKKQMNRKQIHFKYAIYLSMNQHLMRTTGITPVLPQENKTSPKYEIKNGLLTRAGFYNFNPLNKFLNQFELGINLRNLSFYLQTTLATNHYLYYRVISKISYLIYKHYKIRLTIIHFGYHNDLEYKVLSKYKKPSDKYYLIALDKDIIQQKTFNLKHYISKKTDHPNELSTHYIVNFLLKHFALRESKI